MIRRLKLKYIGILGLFFLVALLVTSLSYNINSSQYAKDLMITEVMIENASSWASSFGTYDDYIEVYNPTDQIIQLSDYYLADSKKKRHAWQLPDVHLLPKNFTIIRANSNDLTDQTSIKLNNRGECLILSKADGTIIQQLYVDNAGPNIAYGYDEITKRYAYYLESSPHAMSEGFSFDDPQAFKESSKLEWSVEGGIYDQPFTLSLSTPVSQAQVRYTTDGSAPTMDSTLYTVPLNIEDASPNPNRYANRREISFYALDSGDNLVPTKPVTKGTVICAQAFIDGIPLNSTQTQTYWVLDAGKEHYKLPIVSVTTDPVNLFDDKTGILVLGDIFNTYRASNPDAEVDGDTPANYNGRGPEWRQAGHFEYIVDGRRVFSQGVGISCFGGWSRTNVKKSLKISASTQYDPDHDRLDYPLIKNATNQHGSRIKSFKHIALRGGSNDYEGSVFRDELVQSLVKERYVATQGYEAVNLFLNGEYWGIYWIREVLDRYYLEDHYGIDKDDLTMISGEDELCEGTETGLQDYKAFLRFLETADLTDPVQYAQCTERIAINNFIDYQWIEIFSGNNDWPGNNVKLWKGGDSAPHSLQKWRYLLFDADFAFTLYDDEISSYNYNHFDFASDPDGPDWPNPPWSTFIFRKLLESPTFKAQFLDRGKELMTTHLTEDVVSQRVSQFVTLLEKDMPENISRYNLYELSSMQDWESNIKTILTFAKYRPGVMLRIIEKEMQESAIQK